MADLQAVKERYNLLDLVEADLGPGHKSGRWVLFSCPFPGHAHGDSNPSLSVTPDNGRYFCFTCARSGDVLTWLTEYRGLSWKAIFEAAGVDPESLPRVPRPAPPPPERKTPPAAIWQECGLEFIDYCESALWAPGGAKALRWLQEERGLKPDTIRAYRLGYNPADLNDNPTGWGFDMAIWQEEHKEKRRPDKLWVPRGVTIPWLVGGDLWGVNVRRPAGDPKYYKLPGSKAALFGADNLRGAELILLTEGELDCILASQELGDVAGVATLGSATGGLDLLTWGVYLFPARAILAALDTDKPGQRAAADLQAISSCFYRVQVPSLRAGDKDITDYYRAGGELWPWFKWQLKITGVLAALGVAYDDNPGEPANLPQPVALVPELVPVLCG